MKLLPLLFSTILTAAQPGWFVDAAYTYLWAGEEGLEIGRSAGFVPSDDPYYDTTTSLLSQPSSFESGFTLGFGYHWDDWTTLANYYWIRNTTSQNVIAPPYMAIPDVEGVYLVAPWFLQEAGDGGSMSASNLTSAWRLAMDIGDLSVSYPFYRTSSITFAPFGGLRTAFIRQKMDLTITEPDGLFTPNPPQPLHSTTYSNSWSLGPRFGAEAQGHAGGGWRVSGTLALSLLYTDYRLSHSEDFVSTTTELPAPQLNFRGIKAFKPVFETGAGLGWKGNLNNGAIFDFAIDYDFMLWWNQNEMRSALDQCWREISSNGNLYLQGLVVTFRYGY